MPIVNVLVASMPATNLPAADISAAGMLTVKTFLSNIYLVIFFFSIGNVRATAINVPS